MKFVGVGRGEVNCYYCIRCRYSPSMLSCTASSASEFESWLSVAVVLAALFRTCSIVHMSSVAFPSRAFVAAVVVFHQTISLS